MQQKIVLLKEKDVYNAKIKNIENNIPSITNLATTTAHNAKTNKIKNEIPDITNLAATTVRTAVKNKRPNVSNLIKKLTIPQELVKLKKKLILIIIMIKILLLKNLTRLHQKMLLQDSNFKQA